MCTQISVQSKCSINRTQCFGGLGLMHYYLLIVGSDMELKWQGKRDMWAELEKMRRMYANPLLGVERVLVRKDLAGQRAKGEAQLLSAAPLNDGRVQCSLGMGREEDEALSTDSESTSEGAFSEALVVHYFRNTTKPGSNSKIRWFNCQLLCTILLRVNHL